MSLAMPNLVRKIVCVKYTLHQENTCLILKMNRKSYWKKYKEKDNWFPCFRFVKFKVADWHIAWLCSAVPVLLGMSSLPKNKLGQMYAFVIGYIILGFGSLIYGGTKYSKTFVEHVYQKSPQMLDVRGFSLNLAILGLVLQMQIMALYYAIRLIGAWQSKGEKKTS